MTEHCYLATGHQGFPPGDVGDLQHFCMDPPVGWLTGSGLSGLNGAVDGQAGTLALAPLVGVELCWGPSSWLGHSV